MKDDAGALAAACDAPGDWRGQRGTIYRLAAAQALAGANSTVIFATGAIIGATLAPTKALATLPVSIFVVGMTACIPPCGAIVRKYGRRASFLTGTGSGVLTGLLAAVAVITQSFWLFCLANFFAGAYAAVVFSFRFAATDCVAAAWRPRALSLVMAGGVAAGVIGPQLVTATMYLWQPYLFAATFLAQAVVAALSAVVLWGVRLPPPQAAAGPQGRSLAEIARQPGFIIAAICGAASYMLMNFLMTAAPLAMRMCGLSQESSNLGLQWHVIAMYGPSFITGKLITRFGAKPVVAAGFVLIGAAAAVGLAGVDVMHFWLTLTLLGAGWNFGFVGASAMVLDTHRPEEKTRAQGLNDFIVFGTVAVGSFSSGGLLITHGWNVVLMVSFAPLLIAAVALGSSVRVRKAPGQEGAEEAAREAA